MRILYLCYFGLREPLVQTQVLPYLRQMAASGIQVELLTFESQLRKKWTKQDLTDQQTQLNRDGVTWWATPYHKRPSLPASLYDIVAGAWIAARLVRRRKIDALHARAHLPMAMALLAARVSRRPIVFDIRGLMAEEYADAGIWREGSLKFRMVKKLEQLGVKKADQVVVLTNAMKTWLVENGLKAAGKITVIPCCVDFSSYAHLDHLSGQKEAFEVVYAGSVTGLYMLEEMGKFFLELQSHQPRAFFRVLTTSSAIEASKRLLSVGLDKEHFFVGRVSPNEVPGYLHRARLGISFRKPTFSQIAASPTKIPEYLAAGIPVVCNQGIGDMDDLLERENVGVLVRGFTTNDFRVAAKEALRLTEDPEVRQRTMKVARRHFDLDMIGGPGYSEVYKSIDRSLRGNSKIA